MHNGLLGSKGSTGPRADIDRHGWLHAQAYDDEILGTLREAVLAPLAGHIEGDLRIHAHATQQAGMHVDPKDPSVRSVAPLLRLHALRLLTRALCIK